MDCNAVPLVSIDFIRNLASCTFDATRTTVVDRATARVMGWCGNEWGFCSRLSDTVALFGSL
jgi:glyceraldehyde 3-phosphate dehydrogenase